ncbi:MAG: hypothetical protein QF893_09695 [Alphaproteobacteria bacterium]|jgi:hypothetical protein|nr:hypothetical protein [Alphaproteobacteria bacterium]
MFHRHHTQAFDPAHAPYDTGGHWYVTDAEYQAAVQRGMRLRSEVAAGLVKSLATKLGELFRG